MQPHTQTNHLSLILLASLLSFTNALPQTVQTRPAVVVNREPSSSNSAMEWVQNNLFYSLLGVAGLAVLIYFIVRHWRRKKGKKDVKVTAVEDRGPSEEEKAAMAHKATQQNFMDLLIGTLSRPFK